jgi:hypothetical protein
MEMRSAHAAGADEVSARQRLAQREDFLKIFSRADASFRARFQLAKLAKHCCL